ncbi:hypothetical protein D0B54_14255 [Solimonas sp. K1W22B-7]|uniref:hypothetical protein n=1 Tax=Solimonas sp. K1W22B-7 TaxID=2303331 RepID=UPI000E3355B5|nr:hypothetical protein [Solimonas sp. K1W22B-7]AXQ29765.1 hypothetical protein D0B54_14255 [Solimonas sp. K1W22B-7]
MEQVEARSAVKSIYLLAASLAGLEVSPHSPEQLVGLVDAGFGRVETERRPEAVANLLRIVAMALQLAQENKESMLHEGSVPAASEKVCPVYPFK